MNPLPRPAAAAQYLLSGLAADDSPQAHHHETGTKDRVSLSEKIGMGFGRAVANSTHGALHVLLSPIYNMTMGVNPALISTVVLVQRLSSALMDPVFGRFSDNFRSRWGRRRPLILAGAFPLALFFVMLWWFPRHAGSGYLFWHLLLVSLAFYAAQSLFDMPVGGLIIEATDDYHERTRLAGVTLAFGFTRVCVQWIFPLTQWSGFHDRITGLRWVSVACGLVFLVLGLVPFFLCRERNYARVVVKQPPIEFWKSLGEVRGNKSFVTLLWVRCVYSFCFNVVGMLGGYMMIYYVFGGDLKAAAIPAAILGSSYHVAAILTSLFVYPRLERRFGKRCTLQIAAAVLVIDCISKIFLYHPGHPWQPIAIIMMNGVSNAGVTLMCIAMLGDLTERDELETGLQRAGLFNSLLSWSEKAGNSVGSFLTGFLLYWIGFDAKLGSQPQQTLWLMKGCYVVFPAIGALLTVFLVSRYKLSQDDVYRIQEQLALRRAQAATQPGHDMR